MKKILVATDLSERSDRALQRALMLAHERIAGIEVLHVIDDDWPHAVVEQHEREARIALFDQIAALPFSEVMKPEVSIVRGQDYIEILKRAEDTRADLIVLGIHRHSILDLFRGTTAEKVIRYGRSPVLLVKNAVAAAYRRVVVGVDMSAHSLRALSVAVELAPGGDFQIAHATHAPFKGFLGKDTIGQLVEAEQIAFGNMIQKEIESLKRTHGAAAPRCEIVVREGLVRDVLNEQIDKFRPDLIAIGTHGRTGIALAFVGSVAEDFLQNAPADVLVVKAW